MLRMKQADLARAVEISPSYLNLIEHNRRRIGGKLLVRLASVLDVEPAVLSAGGDAVLLQDVTTLASLKDGLQEGGQSQVEQAEDFVARFPGWAQFLCAQQRRIEGLERRLQHLNDRLSHDPILSEQMQDMLGAVASIRSTSSILVATPDLGTDWRARFQANIDHDSRRLAQTSEAMAHHLDQLTRDDTGFASASDAVAVFMERHAFHIAKIEAEGAAAIPSVMSAAPEFTDTPSRDLGRDILSQYAEDAERLPFQNFVEQARAAGFDPLKLAAQYQCGVVRVFRRLASLPRDPERPEIGLISCDRAGALLMRKAPVGLALPRFGPVCARWPLFAALQAPGSVRRDVLETEQGTTFDSYSIAEVQDPYQVTSIAPLRAYMLLIARPREAPQELDALAVGATCRICARDPCAARREPSVH